MCSGCVLQLVGLVDGNGNDAFFYHLEEIFGMGQQVFRTIERLADSKSESSSAATGAASPATNRTTNPKSVVARITLRAFYGVSSCLSRVKECSVRSPPARRLTTLLWVWYPGARIWT